jgi:hypothetical protein
MPTKRIHQLAVSGRDEHYYFFSIYMCSGSMETKLKNGQLQLQIELAHGTQTWILRCDVKWNGAV